MSAAPQLFPKPPKKWRLRQPRKDELRRQLEVARAETAWERAYRDEALHAHHRTTARTLALVLVLVAVAAVLRATGVLTP